MKKSTDRRLSRRDFLKMAATVTGSAALAGAGVFCGKSKEQQEMLTYQWYLNPAFRIDPVSNSEVELFTHLKDGERISHRFSGLEADLLLSLEQKVDLSANMGALAQKYAISAEECHKRVDQSLRELLDSNIIYHGEEMKVKIVEEQHG